MACRNAYRMKTITTENAKNKTQPVTVEKTVTRLLFGIDTKIETDGLLQNNLTQFEWAIRNKIHPNFVGRTISGENSLNREEIKFLHRQGCKITAMITRIRISTIKVKIFALPVSYHISTVKSRDYYFLASKSRRRRVYHPQLVAVYHQHEVLYIIKPQKRYTLARDEIQPVGLMIYTTAS